MTSTDEIMALVGGCPVCSGDCAGANPPVIVCPMTALRAAVEKLEHELANAHGVAQACELRAERAEAELRRFKQVGQVEKHTGSLKDMAIIVWTGDQPKEGTILYVAD